MIHRLLKLNDGTATIHILGVIRMTTFASTFVIQTSQLPPDATTARSVFEDVEDGKQRLLALRRSGKRRPITIHTGSANSASNVNGSTELDDNAIYGATVRLLLETESSLVEAKSLRQALEERKIELQSAMNQLSSLIGAAESRKLAQLEESDSVTSTAEATEAPPSSASLSHPKKKQRYFEPVSSIAEHRRPTTGESKETPSVMEGEDLSSVVCPYELLGKCTDFSCPHMHLNR